MEKNGENGKPRGEPKQRGSHCEAEAGRTGTEETESQVAENPKESRRKKADGRKEYGKRKRKVSTCGTAVGAKQGSAKGN